ncbi:MAG: response regulator [Aggregatilineales bacterium]
MTKSKVLVVDDQYPAAQMLERLFLNANYETRCAYNGEEAIQSAHEFDPDLILLDVMMPGMDGFEVLTHLRADEATANIPAIMVTARAAPADIEHGLELGADDYIPKPVEPREILARAKSKIEGQRLRNALQRRTKDLEALLYLGHELRKQHRISELIELLIGVVYQLSPCDVILYSQYDEEIQDYAVQSFPIDADVDFDSIDLVALSENAQAADNHINVGQPSGTAYSTSMTMALVSDKQSHGELTLLFSQIPDSGVLTLLEGIEQQVSLALRNAALYETLLDYTEKLEMMVDERTRELRSAQQLLIRSEKLASIGRLAGGIAHEINNPLLPILINLELVQEDIQEGRPVQISDIEETLKSAGRIKRIVDRLLQFIRPRSITTPEMEALHISSVVDSVILLSQKFIQQSNITINTHYDADAHVYGNRDQLEQVFLNLMINARAAMDDGGTLTIKTRVEEHSVVAEFNDTGSGIAENIIDNIFEPFVSTKEDGSGLGLFISYGIIQDHSGKMDVESTVGQGTTFTIHLPVINEDTERTVR